MAESDAVVANENLKEMTLIPRRIAFETKRFADSITKVRADMKQERHESELFGMT